MDHLHRHGCVITAAQILDLGGDVSQITALVRSGVLVRSHRGVYVQAAAASDPEVATRAALAAARGGLASHFSAAWLEGMWDRPPREVHLTTTAHRRGMEGIVVHRTAALPLQRSVIRGVPCTAPARTLVDIAALVRPSRLADALDRALANRLLREKDLIAEIAAGKGRPGTDRLRRALAARATTGPTPSVLESRMARLFRRYDLPSPKPEHVAGSEGEYRIDYAYPGPRVALELYGYIDHRSPRHMQRDLARQRRLTLEGWTVLVFTWHDVTHRPDEVAATIRSALAGPLSRNSQAGHIPD